MKSLHRLALSLTAAGPAFRLLAPVAIVSRFMDAVDVEIAGCPISARSVPASNTDACGACPYNVVFPGQPRIGCSTRTPIDVFDGARAHLLIRDPKLCAELERLCRAGATEVGDAKTREWLALAEAWFATAETDDEREVASVAARFARAAIDRGVRVSILG
ncbi:MAG: hypothetical protein HY791_20475 [Deltaproteobacteria bacterium]|nr:hypothetical protein [Deltaproteobacteria bacterium]